MFLRIFFKKMCSFVNLFLKLNIYIYIYVLSSNFKILDIKKMIYHYFLLNLLNIEIFCLLVVGGVVMKMDNFHLFEEVLKFLFHA
jgi:hypothetical protein